MLFLNVQGKESSRPPPILQGVTRIERALPKWYSSHTVLVQPTAQQKSRMAVDNKKEQERAELHRTIWAIANDLRGSVDGLDFKRILACGSVMTYRSTNLSIIR